MREKLARLSCVRRQREDRRRNETVNGKMNLNELQEDYFASADHSESSDQNLSVAREWKERIIASKRRSSCGAPDDFEHVGKKGKPELAELRARTQPSRPPYV